MEDIRYERKELAYEDLSATFKLADRDFNKQYAGIYAVRLLKFQTLLEARVEIKWGINLLFQLTVISRFN